MKLSIVFCRKIEDTFTAYACDPSYVPPFFSLLLLHHEVLMHKHKDISFSKRKCTENTHSHFTSTLVAGTNTEPQYSYKRRANVNKQTKRQRKKW